MPLRLRLQFIVFAWTAAILACAVLILRPWVFEGYETLEKELLRRDVERVKHGVDLRLDALLKYAKPFAAWDATYDYLSTWDEAGYIQKEYAASVLLAESIDTVVFLRADGLAASLVKVEADGTLRVTKDRKEWQKFSRVAGQGQHAIGEGKALNAIDGVPYALAHAPIVRTNGEGPPAGQLIMAARITPSFVDDVERIVRLGLTLASHGADSGSLLEDVPGVVSIHPDGYEMRIPFMDSNGAAALTVGFQWPRVVMQVGRRSNNMLLLAILLSSLIFGALLHFLLKVTVVRRLENFHGEIDGLRLINGDNDDSAGGERDLPVFVPDSFNDEISGLKRRVDAALRRIVALEDARLRANASLAAQENLSRLGEMAGGIAHEINNPMTIVKGNCMKVAMLLQSPTPEPAALSACVASIEAAADRVAKIVLSMRTFSRDGKADPLKLENVSLLVERSLSLLEFRYRGIRDRVDVDLEAGLFLQCREVQVVQILTNLVSNACDATSLAEEGRVRIMTRFNEGMLVLDVWDQGPGIDASVESKMFQPFFTTKAVGSGTGLGLSISLSLAQQHGGKMAYSRKDGWTRFSLVLPLACIIQREEKLTA